MAFIEDTLQGPRPTGTWLDEQDVVEKRKVKDKVVVKPTVAQLMPVVDITGTESFEMRDGTYLDMVQLTSKDIYSLNEEEKDHDVFSLAYLLQAYTHPLKVVPLNTPLSLERQKISIERQIRQNQTPAYLPFLLKKKAGARIPRGASHQSRLSPLFLCRRRADATRTEDTPL